MVMLVMYAHHLIITRNNNDHIRQFKHELQAIIKMIDLGLLHYYIGEKIFQ
jgi:hypothetical protein